MKRNGHRHIQWHTHFFTLINCVFFVCAWCVTSVLWAADDIQLNGVSSNKAVMTINGQYVMMRQGESKQGYTLDAVNSNGVVVLHKGQRKHLSLSVAHKSSSGQKTTAISNARPQAGTRFNQANSHIISVVPVSRQLDRTVFRVTYFYNGNHGTHAQLRARTRLQGKETGFSSHSYVSLEEGRNQVDITVMMSHNAPQAFYSDDVLFDVLGSESVDNSYLVLSQAFPFARKWQKPEKTEPNFVLGNTTQWQTGKR